MGEVGAGIVDKGYQHKHAVDGDNGGDPARIHIRQHHHQDQTDEEDRGADLAGDQSAGEHFALAQGQKTCDQLEAFLDDEQNRHDPQNRIPDGQADDQGKLSCLVSHRIQNLANVGDHVEVPGDLTVHQVGDAADRKNRGRQEIVRSFIGVQIYNYINRNQNDPKQAQQVWNRK